MSGVKDTTHLLGDNKGSENNGFAKKFANFFSKTAQVFQCIFGHVGMLIMRRH